MTPLALVILAPETLCSWFVKVFSVYFQKILMLGAIRNSVEYMNNSDKALAYHGIVLLLIPLICWNLARTMKFYDTKSGNVVPLGRTIGRVVFGG